MNIEPPSPPLGHFDTPPAAVTNAYTALQQACAAWPPVKVQPDTHIPWLSAVSPCDWVEHPQTAKQVFELGVTLGVIGVIFLYGLIVFIKGCIHAGIDLTQILRRHLSKVP